MLPEPNCSIRKCKHFKGVTGGVEEEGERVYCTAFPKGIPMEIAYGRNKHLSPFKGQKNKIVFEKK